MMKCLVQTARNIRHTLIDGIIYPSVEAVLTLSDKHAEYIGGNIATVEKCETVRFSLPPEAARQFAKHLIAWADEAEQQQTFLSVSAEMRAEIEKMNAEGGE